MRGQRLRRCAELCLRCGQNRSARAPTIPYHYLPSCRCRRTGRPTETSGRGNFAPDGARRRADASMDATRPVPDGAPDGRSGPGRGRTQPDGPGRGRTGARRRTGPPTGAGPEARPAGRHSPDGARRGPDRVKTSPGQTARAPDRTSARGPLTRESLTHPSLYGPQHGFTPNCATCAHKARIFASASSPGGGGGGGLASGFIAGKSNTSRMEFLFVRNIVNLSIPVWKSTSASGAQVISRR